eukprot:88728-Pelagomonas_calceolata.AAC.1
MDSITGSEPVASSNPPDPHEHFYFTALWWRGLTALLSQCVSFPLIDVGRDPSAYAVFSSCPYLESRAGHMG